MNRWLVLAFVSSLAACGGKSQSESAPPNSSAAGTSGTGGSAGSGAGGSAGVAGDLNTCPALEPAPNASCASNGQCCDYSYDACASSFLCCVQNRWVPSGGVSGASYDCNSFSLDNLPANGSSCLCQGILDCFYGSCAQGGVTELRCDNSTWSVTQSACPAGTPCGPSLTCQNDEICTLTEQVGGNGYACKPNLCQQQGKTNSCDCADACGSWNCFLQETGVFYCSCPICAQ